MKTLILILTSLISLNTFADGRQICGTAGGTVIYLRLEQSPQTQVPVCQLGFESLIEINTLDRSYFNDFGPEANRAYRETKYYDFQACERFYGRNYRAKDSSGKLFLLCAFRDRSIIGTQTLSDGVNSNWNRELNRALGIF